MINIEIDNNRRRRLKTKQELQETLENEGESENVFVPGLREQYQNRLKGLEGITIIEYATKWQHFGKVEDVPKKHQRSIQQDCVGSGCVAKRTTELIPRYQFLSVTDNEGKSIFILFNSF